MSMSMSIEVPSSVVSYLNRLVNDTIMKCSETYGFDGEEAVRRLGVVVSVEKVVNSEKKVVKKVEKVVNSGKKFKGSFPLPYNGGMDESCCSGLKENHELFTQCRVAVKGVKYCKTCQNQADENENGEPNYGTIQKRMSVGLMEYVDPKGRSPKAYLKVMKKLNLSMEDVLEEASRVGMSIAKEHLEGVEESESVSEVKKVKKVENVEKKGKGRPKKAEKVIELSNSSDDLFECLVASAQKEEVEPVKKVKEAVEKIEKKKEKKSSKEEEKVVSMAEVYPEKAMEEVKKPMVSEKVVEVEKKPMEEVKKPLVLVKPVEVEEEEEEEEVDEVVRVVFEGKKYLRSEKTGVIYNMDEEVVGKWNSKTKKIDFDEVESDEEEEEEYEEEE